MKSLLFIYYILFNLLIAQFGLNIFSFSCYCLKEITTTLLPNAIHCNKISGKSCCKKNICNISKNKLASKCGKKEIKYTSLDFVAELLQFSCDLDQNVKLINAIQEWSLLQKSIQLYPIPGHQLFTKKNPYHIQYCNWLC